MLSRILALMLSFSLLQGCAAPLVIAGGSAAAGVMVAKDRRTAGTMLDDQGIELKIQQGIADNPDLLENTHISVTSYNGIVLLTGEAELPLYRHQVQRLAKAQPKVREIRNAIEIAPASDSASRKRDAVLTGRVKSRLIGADGVDANSIKVVSDKGTVYLMGLVSQSEAARAVDMVRHTEGVARIVKVFEYTDTTGKQ